MIDEREAGFAASATHSFLASLVLAVLERIDLNDRDDPRVGPPDDEDRIHLQQLRHFLAVSVGGATLSGVPAGDSRLVEDTEGSVDDKLHSYAVVSALVPPGTDYQQLIAHADPVLRKLEESGSGKSLDEGEQQFVRVTLTSFLRRLERSSDLVVTDTEPLGLHQTLG